jgi:hypothetical protein
VGGLCDAHQQTQGSYRSRCLEQVNTKQKRGGGTLFDCVICGTGLVFTSQRGQGVLSISQGQGQGIFDYTSYTPKLDKV